MCGAGLTIAVLHFLQDTALCSPCAHARDVLARPELPLVKSPLLDRDVQCIRGLWWFVPRSLDGSSTLDLWQRRGGDKPRQVFENPRTAR